MKAIIMAAGKGTRLAKLGGDLPKVLRCAGGKTLLAHVLETASCCKRDDIVIVTGYMADKVENAFRGYKFIRQGSEAYGTGYAVMCGMTDKIFNGYNGEVIILNGDMPLVRRETVESMLSAHRSSGCACTLLSCVSRRDLPFGRIIRGENNKQPGNVTAVVEHDDCTSDQRKVRELNVGVYIYGAAKLRFALSEIKNNNKKNEYYLTDTISALIAAGDRVDAFITSDEDEMWGVNTPEDLDEIASILKKRSQ